MAAHRYGNATSTDFFAAMAKASGDPRIVPAMQSFTDQQGVPLINFTPGPKGSFRVSQSRYTLLGASAPALRWGVPLCVRRGASARQCQLLTGLSVTFALRGAGPLIPNVGGTGYYRFELPRAEWDKLIAAASDLPSGEAQAFSDSLYASFRAGRASAAQLLAGAEHLARNPDSYASKAGMENLQGLFDIGLLNEAGEAGYRRLAAQIYAPQLKTLGFTARAGA